MKVLVVDDDKLARKGLISIMDWGNMDLKLWAMSRMAVKRWNF